MPMINPGNLRLLRNRADMTLDMLAEASGVDRVTISRIENEPPKDRRGYTLERLAKALQTETKALTGPDITEDERERKPSDWKSLYEVELPHDVRNALTIVALRYKVNPANIIQMAPFLFLWAAEKSLARRQENLDRIEQGWKVLQDIPIPDHLPAAITYPWWKGEDAVNAERKSIRGRDLFGITLEFEDDLSNDFDSESDNPFAAFLSDLASETNEQVSFEYWSRYLGGPEYSLAPGIAEELVDGNSEAAAQIVTGVAPLHELPADVRKSGKTAIAEWAVARGEEFRKDFDHIDLSKIVLDLENGND